MRGKTVNFFMAFLNILLGITLILFSFKIPQSTIELTVQENNIVNILKNVLKVVLIIITLINVVEYFSNSQNPSRKNGYLISFFSIGFLLINNYILGVIAIVGGVLIIYGTLKEKWIELNSITFISIIGILMVSLMVIIGVIFTYKNIGAYIIKKQNKGEISYKPGFFKYIKELEYEDKFINAKKGEKYGYVNAKGETLIDFKYDYASPFVYVESYNKIFEVALVTQDGRSQVILKNERIVMSYRSESQDNDFGSKKEEFENIYKNILNQTRPMQFEILEYDIKDRIKKVKVSSETSEEYTYKYPLSEEYDILVITSSMGLGDTYQLVKKGEAEIKLNLECENLDYDENYLYIYDNGNIPFYERSFQKQGWFTPDGKKEVLNGNAQILEFIDDEILIKDHNNNTIYFITEQKDSKDNIKVLSPTYKELCIINEKRFLVKKQNNKYALVNEKFEEIIPGEWDFVDTSLLNIGLLSFGKTNGVIEFDEFNNAKNLKLKTFDLNGLEVLNNIGQIYNTFYEISNDEKVKYSDRYSNFLSDLKKLNISFVGDKFYD